MSKYNIGKSNPMYGRHHSEESKKLMGQIHKGKRHTEETKQAMSKVWHKTHIVRFAENSSFWKGDKVSYQGLHKWLRRHLPSSQMCQICNKEPSYDVANITGNYQRDFNNWKRICRRCHMKSDGRMNNLRHQST